jgi:hypothetical protein
MLDRSGFPSDGSASDFPSDGMTTTEGIKVYQDERRWAALRADRDLLARAAAWLRSEAIRAGYAGLTHQHVAFALALILDELVRHLPDLDEGVRRQAVQSSRILLGEQVDSPAIRRTRRR